MSARSAVAARTPTPTGPAATLASAPKVGYILGSALDSAVGHGEQRDLGRVGPGLKAAAHLADRVGRRPRPVARAFAPREEQPLPPETPKMNAPRTTWGATKTLFARRIRSRSPSISGATIIPSKLSFARSTAGVRPSHHRPTRAWSGRSILRRSSAAATSRLRSRSHRALLAIGWEFQYRVRIADRPSRQGAHRD